MLKNRAAGRVRARLEDGPQTTTGITLPERSQRFAERGRMMSEIVDHRHSPRFAPHFLTPRDPLKTRERLLDFRDGNAVEASRGDRHRRVADVEFTAERHLKFIAAEGEARSLSRIGGVADLLRAVG